jgi:hypothetical protein
MDQSAQYGQMEFNLPHDVVKLPSGGVFYKPKKESLKVGYLTASDENILMSNVIAQEGFVQTLLRQKIYEPGFDITQLLNCDVEAILLFLRNTSFGDEYDFKVNDPKTNIKFDVTIKMDRVKVKEAENLPDENGHFTFILPKSKKTIKLRLLNLGDNLQLEKLQENYPNGMVVPIITSRLEKAIVSIDGDSNKENISKFVSQMPIIDSKEIRRFLKTCEPQLDLNKKVKTPSGEEVDVQITFGVEFFRPFFSI